MVAKELFRKSTLRLQAIQDSNVNQNHQIFVWSYLVQSVEFRLVVVVSGAVVVAEFNELRL